MDLVRVGVSVILFNKESDKVLLGHRLSEHGYGTWGFPGGAIEPHEDPFTTARREIAEEIGKQCELAVLSPFSKVPWGNIIFPSGQHWITLFFRARLEKGEPRVMEPAKCREWKWFSPRELPDPLFAAADSIRDFWTVSTSLI